MNNPASQQERDPITHRFIGHAMKVHSLIGPGLSEEIYHQELVSSLKKDGVEHLSKLRRDLIYRGYVADTFEPDFVVENHFIPELKSLQGKFSPVHMVQAFCYCKGPRVNKLPDWYGLGNDNLPTMRRCRMQLSSRDCTPSGLQW